MGKALSRVAALAILLGGWQGALAAEAALLHGVDGGIEPLFAAGEEEDGRTRFGQAFRGFRAEAAGAAGDEGGFSRQIKEFAHVSHGGSV